MGFKQGAIAKVWTVEPAESGKFVKARVSISRKNADGTYEQDFADYIRFVGKANIKARAELKAGDRVRIDGTDVTTFYNKETNRQFTNFIVFDYQDADEYFRQHAAAAQPRANPVFVPTEGDDESVEAEAALETVSTELPF